MKINHHEMPGKGNEVLKKKIERFFTQYLLQFQAKELISCCYYIWELFTVHFYFHTLQ